MGWFLWLVGIVIFVQLGIPDDIYHFVAKIIKTRRAVVAVRAGATRCNYCKQTGYMFPNHVSVSKTSCPNCGGKGYLKVNEKGAV